MDDILGVLVAGGFSSRMGSDKALLLTPEGKTWIEKQHDLLLSFFYRVAISVRPKQDYSQNLPEALYIIDEEIAAGPLRGILSVHRQYPAQHLFVAAIDLPFLNSTTISKILIHFRKNPEADIVLFKTDFYEPLCAVYSSRFLASLNKKIQQEEIKNFSIQELIENSQNKIVLLMTENDIEALRNINYPEDFS